MKRAFLVIFLYLLFFFLLGTYVWHWISFTEKQGNASSDNIAFSKANNLLINEYVLVDDTTTRKYNMNNNNVECWTEHIWNVKAKFVYWHPIQTVEGYQILLERTKDIDTTIKLSIDKMVERNGGTPVVHTPNGSIQTISKIPEADTLKAFIYACPSSPPILLDSFYLVKKK